MKAFKKSIYGLPVWAILCGRETRLRDSANELKRGQDMTEEQTKICAKCNIEKPLNKFGIRKSAQDGRNPMCLECRRQYFRDIREKQTRKAGVSGSKSKKDKLKIPKPPQEKTTIKPEELAEARFIDAFKRETIKAFIKNDLIPMLETIIGEKFEGSPKRCV
jgi:hypothetical protein